MGFGVLAGGIVLSCLEGRKAEVMEIEEGALWGSGLVQQEQGGGTAALPVVVRLARTGVHVNNNRSRQVPWLHTPPEGYPLSTSACRWAHPSATSLLVAVLSGTRRPLILRRSPKHPVALGSMQGECSSNGA